MKITSPSADPLLDPGLTRRQRAEATAERFEQIFVQQMVQSMRSSTTLGGGEGMFGSGPGAGTYEDWFDQHLSRHLTERGNIGLADVMLRDWERKGWIGPARGETDGHA